MAQVSIGVRSANVSIGINFRVSAPGASACWPFWVYYAPDLESNHFLPMAITGYVLRRLLVH
jgi:hypothetical protein